MKNITLKDITLKMFTDYCAQAFHVEANGSFSFNEVTNFNDGNLSKADKSALKDAAKVVVENSGEVEAVNKLTTVIEELELLTHKTAVEKLHELSLEKYKLLVEQKNTQALKAGMTMIVDAYNTAISHKIRDKEGVKEATKEQKREHFVTAMASQLGVDISDPSVKEVKEVKAHMGKAFDSMHAFYGGEKIEDSEKENPRIAQDKTYGEAFKAALLMAFKILTVGLPLLSANLSENYLTSSRSAKTSFADSGIGDKAFVMSGGALGKFAEAKKATFAANAKAQAEEAKKPKAKTI